MKLNLIGWAGVPKEVSKPLGATLHGLRFTSVTLETREEAAAIVNDIKTQEWWNRMVIPNIRKQ